jgi:A118 family predicted phage portal protein
LFSRLISLIKGVIRKLIPYKSIEQVEHIDSPLSPEMINALDEWYMLYLNKAPWLKPDTVKSRNLPAFISSELARSITLELEWNITGKDANGNTQDADGKELTNPRAEYLKSEFEKCMENLRGKLEQGLASGGMTIRPYPKDGHIYFDWTMAWGLYPLAFGDDGQLTDVIFRDTYTEGKTIYTRLERHKAEGDNVHITQRAFKSNMRDSIGTEIPLKSVTQWATLEPEATVTDAEGQLFGWFKTAAANCIDVDSPMGVSCYAKAVDVIKQADLQYSRLLWEYEGSELAIDVDPMVLRQKKDGKGQEMPRLNERLFRGVDRGSDDSYDVFSPTIRDASLVNGLNELYKSVEDLCGLSRGTISDANTDARTATELKINKQRSYATVSDNQKALEHCLKDVIRAMDKFASIYNLAPEGDYDVSFSWDDSIITDTEQQTNERLMFLNAGIISKQEMREWYFGETKAQAKAAIQAISDEQSESLESLLPAMEKQKQAQQGTTTPTTP